MVKGFYKFLKYLLSGPILFFMGIKVVNREKEPRYEDGAYLLCANHLSAMDPVCISAALWQRKMGYMAKKELFKCKPIGSFLRYFGAYPIDRSGANVSAVKDTIKLLQEGGCTAMFPQGTRCPGVHPLETKIKSGAGLIAAKAGVPVLPVLIQNKKWKMGLFRRTEIIIGDLIQPEEYLRQDDAEHINYADVSRIIFDRICALEDKEWK